MANHYEILGVDRSATSTEIAQAYLRKTAGSRTAGFLRGSTQRRSEREAIEEAFNVLTDRAARSAYDRALDES